MLRRAAKSQSVPDSSNVNNSSRVPAASTIGNYRNSYQHPRRLSFFFLLVISSLSLSLLLRKSVRHLFTNTNIHERFSEYAWSTKARKNENKNISAKFPNTAILEYAVQPSLYPLNSPISRFLGPDLGGLEIARSPTGRLIDKNDEKIAAEHRKKILTAAEENDVSSSYWHYEELDWPQDCVRPEWSYRVYPTCNQFHEQSLLVEECSAEYLAHGYYRDSWKFIYKDYAAVLKQLRYRHDSNARMMHKILTEAVVMEVLTPAPTTTNVYGHCATSLLVESARDITLDIVPHIETLQTERGRISQDALSAFENVGEPYSLNNYTASQKLDIAISMAQGLAEMHGYRGGVMVNDDAHPDQWLVTPEGRVVLNDMNNARFLPWNNQKAEYCPYYSSYGGDYRAPEEYTDDGSYVTETVDIWPMGNLIHSLLTGLWPYYNVSNTREIQAATLRGERPYLHPGFRKNGTIEARLTEIMDQCHVLDPTQRVSIFEVVRHLSETKRQFA